MLIDWRIVVVQIINFLILVWLLKRFLYRPVLKAVDTRRDEITNQLQEIALKTQMAEQLREEYERKNAQFDADKQTKTAMLHSELERRKEELLETLAQDVEREKKRWYQQLEDEKKEVCQELYTLIQGQLWQVVCKAVKDVSGKEFEEACIDRFISEYRQPFSTSPLLIRTAYSLSLEQQQMIREKVASDVVFQVTPEIMSGIEIQTEGQKISWNMATYLAILEEKIHAWKRNT